MQTRPRWTNRKNNTKSSAHSKYAVIIKSQNHCDKGERGIRTEDLTEDWREVEKSMGNPAVILDFKDYSYTKRRRAWWVRGLFAGLDPDIIHEEYTPRHTSREEARAHVLATIRVT